MAGITRSHPLFLDGQKVAEVSKTTENRTVNAANQYGTEGVIAQSIGADEVDADFDTVVTIAGMGISIDDLIGAPTQLGIIRNGRMMLSDGVLGSSSYTSDSKSGESKGAFKFVGGAPAFI